MRKPFGVLWNRMPEPAVSLKSKVEKEVLDQLMSGLNSGSLSVENAQQIARDTLVAVDSIEKHEKTVIDFYEGLAKQHPSFEILYTRIKGDVLRAHEVTAYKDALSALDSGDVNLAKNIAGAAIGKTANETDNN